MPFVQTRAPRVYVPNKSTHDFSSAEHYGKLVYLTEGEQNRFKITQMYRQVWAILKDAEPGDYLLISGPTTVNVIAASILAHRFGRVNYLIYDGFTARYLSKPVLLNQLDGGSDVRGTDGRIRAPATDAGVSD